MRLATCPLSFLVACTPELSPEKVDKSRELATQNCSSRYSQTANRCWTTDVNGGTEQRSREWRDYDAYVYQANITLGCGQIWVIMLCRRRVSLVYLKDKQHTASIHWHWTFSTEVLGQYCYSHTILAKRIVESADRHPPHRRSSGKNVSLLHMKNGT